MDTCERCGADLGDIPSCPSCGHRNGAPLPRRQEFLPWSRRAAADPASPGRSLHWGRWVLSATALLVVAAFLVSWLPDMFDDAGDNASAADPATSDPDRPKAVNVARRALVRVPATAPPTTDRAGRETTYGARKMLDGKKATAWRMEGDGTGAVISFRLESPTRVRRVGLINGYARRVGRFDAYPNNRRVLEATWRLGDGTTVEQSFKARHTMQRMKIEPVTTTTVTLTLTRVSQPGPGDLRRDYTALSEVVIIGRPAD